MTLTVAVMGITGEVYIIIPGVGACISKQAGRQAADSANLVMVCREGACVTAAGLGWAGSLDCHCGSLSL